VYTTRKNGGRAPNLNLRVGVQNSIEEEIVEILGRTYVKSSQRLSM